MKSKTKKIDIIIILVIIAITAAVILSVIMSSAAEGQQEQEENSEISLYDFNGKSIGVRTGTNHDLMTLEKLPDATFAYFNDYPFAIEAVKDGKLDAFVADNAYMDVYMKEDPSVSYLDEPIAVSDFGFIFAKTEKGRKLCDDISAYVTRITNDGQLQEMYDMWFGDDESAKVPFDTDGMDNTNGTIKLAAEFNHEPLIYLKDGKYAGYELYIMYRYCLENGYGLEIFDMAFDGLLSAVISEVCDLGAAGIEITPEREESVYFSVPHYRIKTVLGTVDKNAVQSAKTEDRPFSYYAENRKIGVITGGLYEVMIKQRYPDADLYQYNNQSDLGAALAAGVIDCFTVPRSTAEDFMKQYNGITYLNEVFTQIPYGFAFQKSADKEYLRDQMNEFLKKIRDDGTYDEIVGVWFGEDDSLKTVDMTGLTGENGELKMVTTATMQPFSYIKDGKNVGLEIDLAARFCREYGYSLKIDSAEFASLIPGITSGMYDMAAGNIMITAERAESVNFSDIYYTADAVAVVRSEDDVEEKQTGFFDSIADSFEKNFIREDRWKLIIQGIGTTCLITLMSVIFGTLLAFAVCMFRRTGSRLAGLISNIYVKLLQGTPMVVLLMILYYVILGKSGMSAVWVAVVGFSLNFGAYASEIMRSGIESIEGGQREAALALGYSENQTFFRFIFPQATVRFLPVYNGEVISLLKNTSIVGYIAIQDLTKMSDIIRSRTYEAFFPLIATAVIYFILAWIISLILKFILKKVSPGRKRRTI